MNKRTLSAVPDENKIEELLAKIQPVPSVHFHQKMKQTVWRNEDGQPVVMKNFRLKIAFAIITVATLTALLITPQGYAWAQEVLQFFRRINSTTVQLPNNEFKWIESINEQYELPLVPVFIPTVSPGMATLPGCETAQKSQSYGCQVALAESQLGFDLKELAAKPDDWNFEFLHFDSASKSATISYSLDLRYESSWRSYGSLYLIQGLGDLPTFYQNGPWDVVPADKVEIVKIGNYNGEYVKGSFSAPIGSSNLVWSDSDRRKRLAWSDGTKWYLIDLWPNLNLVDRMGRDELIKLAASLVDSSSEKTESLNQDFLYSIADAEKISGLDLKAPTRLPIDMEFSYARYFPDEQQVHLIYGLNESLTVHEWKGNPVNYKKPLGKYEFTCEIINMNGADAFYCFFEGPNPRSFLWWHKDGLNYQMYYDSFSGGQIDKKKMISIAESMQDINDFRKKELKPYEYVSIYEQALGFDAREFQIPTTGWAFASVWADAHARCIGLFYTSTAEQGSLFINQCSTDKYFDVSTLPSSSIQRARIGNTFGQYVSGNFVTANNGKSIWDPAVPLKQLYWREDGLWIQMTVYGESAVRHDKEDLIYIAESLR